MEKNNDKVHQMRFLSLVVSLHGSAWIALGKVANPVSGKVEKDLEAARAHINLLETLKVKTKGNLSPEEDKLLSGYLSALQLNYVEESSGEKEKSSNTPPPEAGERNPEPEKKP